MALDGTYSGLKASVADFLNRADLSASIPDFIALAEAQMARRFVKRAAAGTAVPRRLVERATVNLTAAQEYATVPTDMMGPVTLTLPTDPITDLAFLERENFLAQKARGYWTGAPRYFTVVGSDFQLLPVSDQVYAADLTYIKRLAALSDSNPGNWILTDHPDAYLYGALTQSAPYLKDDSRITLWGSLFETAVEDICSADPMPSDNSRLRTEVGELQILGSRYGINNGWWA